jgi:putative flippase GtrA
MNPEPMVGHNAGLRTAWLELLRIVRFGFVGGSVAICYAAITFLIVWSGLAGSLVATIIGHLIASVLSYLGHLHFTFGVAADHRTFLSRFAVVAAATLALNVILTWFLVSVLHSAFQIPILVVTIAIPAANYLLNRFWVFLPGLRGSSGKR